MEHITIDPADIDAIMRQRISDFMLNQINGNHPHQPIHIKAEYLVWIDILSELRQIRTHLASMSEK